jgi:hypothetical protein
MPDVDGGGLFGSAVRAAREGLSAAAWIRTLQSAGAGIRRQVALRLYREAKTVAAESGEEATRELGQVPSLDEMPPSPTRNTAGVLQTVRLIYRERVTGNLRTVFHSTKSENGVTRQEAIDAAIAEYSQHSEEYQTDLVGAVHTSALRLTPVSLDWATE